MAPQYLSFLIVLAGYSSCFASVVRRQIFTGKLHPIGLRAQNGLRRVIRRCEVRAQKPEVPRYQVLEISLLAGKLSLNEFDEQLDIFENSGGLEALMDRLPTMEEQIDDNNILDTQQRIMKYRDIISRMTEQERKDVDHLLMDENRRKTIAVDARTSLEDVEAFLRDFLASVNSFSKKPDPALPEPEDKVIPLVMASTTFWHPDKITDVPIQNDYQAAKAEKKVKKTRKRVESRGKPKRGFGSI
uniref:Signal recognition particle SRP54 subunit M-domain domain-containing protein n=1 Tax=Lotharella oceanica TaxID=641309 RepID=A0A7S2TIH9_9EUKA|mmetsp:Transcript_15728/g.29851  ORF Transcript_15728/g.29851 Transcript_15728/m.29851 type:complete len:244 (+) Transcript_15728:5-736(+)